MSLFTAALATLSLLAGHVVDASPVPVTNHPQGVNRMLVTQKTTVNATAPAGPQYAPSPDASAELSINLVNYLSSNNVNAYITGKNANGQLVFLNSNGQWYYPDTSSSQPQSIPNSDIAIPLGGAGSTTSATLPGYLESSRVWFSDGELQFGVVSTPTGPGLVEPAAVNPSDPNANLNYGFGELNWAQSGGIFADISYVDFVGTPIGIQLTTTDGNPMQQALGVSSNAVSQLCSKLQSQGSSDGQPWGSECVYSSDGGALVRVLAPADLISQQPNAFSGYFDNYVNSVYSYYSQNTLTINTQAAAGDVACTADTGSMTISCDGDNRSYPAPNSLDIFGCNNGAFGFESGDNAVHYAVVPRLCAAFNRGTFLINGGNVQPGVPKGDYYTSSPAVYNYYSKFVHELEWEGLGYAFSYDDVSPDGADNVAGTVQSNNPNVLTFLVGGYDLA